MKNLVIAAALAVSTLAGVAAQPAHAQSGWYTCASENQYCRLNGTAMVRYGRNGVYTYQRISGRGFMCNNARFGDPLVGIVKHCQIRGY